MILPEIHPEEVCRQCGKLTPKKGPPNVQTARQELDPIQHFKKKDQGHLIS